MSTMYSLTLYSVFLKKKFSRTWTNELKRSSQKTANKWAKIYETIFNVLSNQGKCKLKLH